MGNRLLSLTQISLFFTLLGGQMVKMGLARTENISESFIDGILIMINVAIVLCTFSFGMLETILKRRTQYTKMKEMRRKNLANRLAVIDAEVGRGRRPTVLPGQGKMGRRGGILA